MPLLVRVASPPQVLLQHGQAVGPALGGVGVHLPLLLLVGVNRLLLLPPLLLLLQVGVKLMVLPPTPNHLAGLPLLLLLGVKLLLLLRDLLLLLLLLRDLLLLLLLLGVGVKLLLLGVELLLLLLGHLLLLLLPLGVGILGHRVGIDRHAALRLHLLLRLLRLLELLLPELLLELLLLGGGQHGVYPGEEGFLFSFRAVEGSQCRLQLPRHLVQPAGMDPSQPGHARTERGKGSAVHHRSRHRAMGAPAACVRRPPALPWLQP